MAHPDDWPRPEQVLQHYRQSMEVVKIVAQAARLPGSPPNAFAIMPLEEMEATLGSMMREIELQCVLSLVASVEASFQTDMQVRVRRRLGDAISRRLRQLARGARSRKTRVEIEEIMEVWKTAIGHPRVFGQFRQVIQFRHWLAHGRYWRQKSGLLSMDVQMAWDRWQQLLRVLPEFPQRPGSATTTEAADESV